MPEACFATTCRTQKIEVTRSRAHKKNDQAFVEQKNGAVVRRLVGCTRVDGRAGKIAAPASPPAPAPDAARFAKGGGGDVARGEQRAIHRQLRKAYKKRMRMPSILDPHIPKIESW